MKINENVKNLSATGWGMEERPFQCRDEAARWYITNTMYAHQKYEDAHRNQKK